MAAWRHRWTCDMCDTFCRFTRHHCRGCGATVCSEHRDFQRPLCDACATVTEERDLASALEASLRQATRPPPPPPTAPQLPLLNVPKFDCPICLSIIPLEEVVGCQQCGEAHRVCRDCLAGHLRAQLGEQTFPITCPVGCRNVITQVTLPYDCYLSLFNCSFVINLYFK